MRVLLVAAALALALGTQGAGAATTATISIKSTGFSPRTTTLDFGARVTWKNVDRADHQVVANDGSFASPVLAPGRTYTFSFTRSGTFHYHDALHPRLTGTITIKGPPPSLTLALDQPIVVYGTQVTLSGKVTGGKPGTTVTLFAQQWGQPSPVQLAIVKTGSDGAFAYLTQPSMYTSYTASFQATPSGPVVGSSAVIAQVAPKVRLLAGGSGYMHAQVTAARSFWHRHLYLQRLSPLGQWVNVASLTLGQSSGRLFRPAAYLPRGLSRIRVFLSINQAGVGLLAAHSGTQLIRKP